METEQCSTALRLFNLYIFGFSGLAIFGDGFYGERVFPASGILAELHWSQTKYIYMLDMLTSFRNINCSSDLPMKAFFCYSKNWIGAHPTR